MCNTCSTVPLNESSAKPPLALRSLGGHQQPSIPIPSHSKQASIQRQMKYGGLHTCMRFFTTRSGYVDTVAHNFAQALRQKTSRLVSLIPVTGWYDFTAFALFAANQRATSHSYAAYCTVGLQTMTNEGATPCVSSDVLF